MFNFKYLEFDKQNDEDEPLPIWMTEDSHFDVDQQWLSFRGNFDALQSICRLKFRLMLYFTRFIADPGRHLHKEDKVGFPFPPFYYKFQSILKELLICTNNVLTSAHKKSNFAPVNNLPAAKDPPAGGKMHLSSSAPHFPRSVHPSKKN
jgi:hypothetical protein